MSLFKYVSVILTRRCAWVMWGVMLSLFSLTCHAQNSIAEWTQRLQTFGSSLPQEEVFIHMDNTSYFLGDTIFYKVYSRRSDGKPSDLSNLLYVELFNQDGYLVERQKVKMTQGQGHGSIALLDSLYGGYYELRAYTRWQLNWGEYQHPHTKKAEEWFYSKKMAQEYYRDYDKLYSRVFPVFDKPKTAGDYTEEMTLRPLRRYFKKDMTEKKATVTLYPEGGHLISGKPCHVAFDAHDESGTHLEGTLTIMDKRDSVLVTAQTESRGRGSFLLHTDNALRYVFEAKTRDGKESSEIGEYNAKGKLPEVEVEGCALHATVEDDGIHLTLHNAGPASAEALGITAMCHGILAHSLELQASSEHQVVIPIDKLPTGVIQISVFNAEGRIYADRLVFVRRADFQPANLTFTGINDNGYQPFAPINLTIHNVNPSTQPKNSTISLAVRDAAHSEYLYDSGNMLTEMLLSSQIKGFVEAPEYFFEANDDKHKRALDLLLMVQGWRRYDWVTMATPKAFTLKHMPEISEVLYGEVNRYETVDNEDLFSNLSKQGLDEALMSPDADELNARYPDFANTNFVRKWKTARAAIYAAKVLKEELGIAPENYDMKFEDPNDIFVEQRLIQSFAQDNDMRRIQINAKRITGDVASERFNESQGNLKRELKVHAEFLQPSVKGKKGDTVEGDMTTYNRGQFKIEAPRFDGFVYFFLGASDSTKWKGKKHIWVENGVDKREEPNYPEFYVKLSPIYPRFVKPYNAYQTQMRELPSGSLIDKMEAGVRNLNELTVRARRTGLGAFDASKPAYVLDAYQAFNDVCDAGLCPGYYIGSTRFVYDIARNYIGDMNMERPYDLDVRFNNRPTSFNMTAFTLQKYNHLGNINKVYVYTDYSPRLEGDHRFDQSNQPSVTVSLNLFEDEGQYMTYRDRYYLLTGYNICDDFYHPDYSTKPLPNTKDYRRTLYWNPNLQLDANGQAKVSFYNNSKTTHISVSAEGMTASGDPLTGCSTPD